MTLWKILFALVIIGLLCLSYAHFIERTWLKIEHVTITSHKLPGDFNLRIVHISDMHIKEFTAFEKKVADSVNAQQPDVIVITGDFFKQKSIFEGPKVVRLPHEIDQIETFLNLLHAPLGIFICRGNNDFSDDKEVSDIFLQRMRASNVTILVNEYAQVNKNGAPIFFLGVDYPAFFVNHVTDFKRRPSENGFCLESGFSLKNSYSHYLVGDNRAAWRDYDYTGKFRQSDPRNGGIGLTFYSQFDQGLDQFYRLRRRSNSNDFLFSPHGAAEPAGNIAFDMGMAPNVWYKFRIACRTVPEGTRMAARVWPAEKAEPEIWQAQVIDTTARFQHGTVGVWSHGRSAHQFDDLCVVTTNNDTLLFEDFETDAFGWVDYNFEGKAIPWLRAQLADSAFAILVSHTPDLVRWADSAQVDLQLSGHTHGGQVKIPLLGPVLTGISIGRKYIQGLHQFGGTQLYVNRGIGTAMLPIRFLSRPEIAVIELRRGRN